MSSQVQFRRGTTGQTLVFTGAVGEVTVNTTSNTLVVHDGVTPGGWPLVGVTQAQTLTNKTLYSATLTGTTSVSSHIIPTANVTYNLGSADHRFNDLYLAGTTVYLGSSTIQSLNGNLTLANGNGYTFVVDNTGKTTLSSLIVSANLVAGSSTTSTHLLNGNVIVGYGSRGANNSTTFAINENNATMFNTSSTVQVFANEGTVGKITLDSVGAGAHSVFVARSAQGTASSPSATLFGDVIGGLTMRGRGATQYYLGSALGTTGIVAQAAEDHTDSAQGTKLCLNVVRQGQILANTAVIVQSNSSVFFYGNLQSTTSTNGTVIIPGVGGLGVGGNVNIGNTLTSPKIVSSNVDASLGNVYAGYVNANNSIISDTITASEVDATVVKATTNVTTPVLTATSTLSVTAPVEFTSSVDIDGAVTVEQDFTITGLASKVTMAQSNGNVTITAGNVKIVPGYSTGLVDNMAVGTNLPSTGKFTTLQANSDFTANGNILVSSRTASYGIGSGALVVQGGAGISGDLYVGGNIVATGNTVIENTYINNVTLQTTDQVIVSNATVSTSTTTGAIITTGGIGVYGNAYVGKALIATGGTVSTGAFVGTYTDGIILDYVNNMGRLSVGSGDSFTIYNGGLAGTSLLTIGATGVVSVPATTTSTSTTTGALVVAGGIGVSGNIITPSLQATAIGNATPGSGAFTTLSSTLGITGNLLTASQTAITTVGTLSGLTVAGGTTLQSTLSVTGDTTLTANLRVNGTTDIVNATTAALSVAGGATFAGNVYTAQNLYIGVNALNTNLTNPTIVASDTGNTYAQVAMKNTNSQGSADYAAYCDLGTDAGGWADMGFTGTAFSDPNYAITKANDGYFIVQPVSSSYGGNLVLGTSNAGSYNDVVIGIGSFYGNAEVARFHGNATTSGYFQITTGTAASSTSTGALRVTGGLGVTGAAYHGSVYDAGNRVLTSLTSSGGGNLTIGGSAPSLTIALPATGPGVTTVGTSTAIPVITTDAYGRITALSTASISTTLGIAGSSGTGSVALASQTLTVSGGAGISSTASGQTINLLNTGVLSVASSGDGNLTVSAATGNITVALPATGPGVTTVGSSTAIPVITTDLYGRVTALSTASIVTTLSTSGGTGTGSVALASQTLNIAGGSGISTSASAQAVTITNTGVLSLASSGSGNLVVSSSTGTVTVSLPTTGPGVATWGGINNGNLIVPTVTTDAYGRVTAASNIALNITSNISGTSGSTGAITNGQTFAFTTTNGMILTASGNSIAISTSQDLRSTASPTFAGATVNGGTQLNGTLGVTGITSVTNNTNSTGAGNGALVVTGGLGVGTDAYFGNDVHIVGNLYVPNLIATSTSTLNTSSPMAYFQVSPSYPYNYETGFYSHFVGGPANVYAHTGFVRNHNNSYWTLFSNVKSEPGTTTVNFADAGLIYDTLQLGGLIASNTTPSTSTTTGAITVAGGVGIAGNLNVNAAGYFGYNASSTTLTNPSIVATSSSQAVNAGQYYVQAGLINSSSTGSADWIAYPNNYPGSANDHGWIDVGFTGNLFSDPSYTITKANDGYIFAGAVAGSGLGGNLVLATDATGTYNDVVVAVGGFYANAEVARFHGNATTSGYFQITTGTAASSTSTGALRVTGGLGVSGSVYANALYTDNLRFANGSAFVSTTLANTTEITANISSGTNVGLSLAATGVTAGNYGSSTSIPTIVVDSKGRITSITSNAVSTTITLAGTTGTGSVAGGGTLTFASTNGVVASVSGSTITISDPQDIRTTASPAFAGASVTGSTASTSTSTGALVVTGGAGIGGSLYVGGNIYQNGVRVFKNTTTSNTAPSNPVAGDEWYNSATDVFYKYVYDGTNYAWVDLISASQPAPTLGAVTANSVTVIAGISAATVTDNGNRVVTSVTATAGTGISVTSATTTGPATGFTVTNTGVTSLVAGTDISISGSTGAVTVNDTSTFATVTGRGATTSTALTVNNSLTMGGHVLPSANVTYNLGSSTAWWGTFYGKATQAQYADLAENYQADAEYAPGTVLMFGGDAEVTLAEENTRAVAGVVSTDPAYLMNGGLTGSTVAPIALQGRVPCKVIGTVRKGDLMVSAGNGFAKADNDPKLGTIIGKALENFNGAEGVIEVVVGRV